jgi:hypothetical protein
MAERGVQDCTITTEQSSCECMYSYHLSLDYHSDVLRLESLVALDSPEPCVFLFSSRRI